MTQVDSLKALLDEIRGVTNERAYELAFPQKIGLVTESGDVPQKSMVRSNQQQIVTVIRRVAKN